jgi:hypothetical protein
LARRRYGKSPAVSQAGQSERPRDPSGDASLQQPVEPRAEYGKPPPESSPEAKPEPAQHFSTGLGEQLRQQQQYAQPDPIDQYISHYFQGAQPNERQWLRANSHHLQNPMLVHHAAGIALQRGIPRQSPEFLQFIGQLLDQHHAAMQAPAPPPPVHEPEPPPVAHVDQEHVEHDHEPDEDRAMASFISAPPSRGDHSHAVEPEPTMGSIRLSAEQRDIAARSGISDVEYAKQLLKMQKMKTSGLIK